MKRARFTDEQIVRILQEADRAPVLTHRFPTQVILYKEEPCECDRGKRFQTLDGQEEGCPGDGHDPGQDLGSQASRSFDLPPSEIEQWVEEGKRGMENALRAKPLDVKEQYERQLKELQEAYGEAMLELRARKKLNSLLGGDEK
jgi:hypothetical protein